MTELMARPLLNLHAPELAVFEQPLAGETAARRELLEGIPFSAGYGVEIAMLIDSWRIAGLDGMAQVDLGTRQNRHQPLRDLSAMAYAVLVAANTRFLGSDFADAHACSSIVLPPGSGGEGMEHRRVTVEERPPLAGCNQHHARAARHSVWFTRRRGGRDEPASEPTGGDHGRPMQRAQGKAKELKGRTKQEAGAATDKPGTQARGGRRGGQGQSPDAVGKRAAP